MDAPGRPMDFERREKLDGFGSNLRMNGLGIRPISECLQVPGRVPIQTGETIQRRIFHQTKLDLNSPPATLWSEWTGELLLRSVAIEGKLNQIDVNDPIPAEN